MSRVSPLGITWVILAVSICERAPFFRFLKMPQSFSFNFFFTAAGLKLHPFISPIAVGILKIQSTYSQVLWDGEKKWNSKQERSIKEPKENWQWCIFKKIRHIFRTVDLATNVKPWLSKFRCNLKVCWTIEHIEKSKASQRLQCL